MSEEFPLKIYGVLGYPARHSLSPLMHNAAFRRLKLNAVYKIFEIKPQDLKHFLKNLDKQGICGLNVTVPYKEKVLDFVSLDKRNSYLKKIGAVNTIVKVGRVYKGYNTDIFGFLRHLRERFNPDNKKVAILGAGGASRAVAYALADSGASEIAIFDIDKFKARQVSRMISSLFPETKISAVRNMEDLDILSKDLLVNATPVGLKKKDPCLVKEKMLHRDLFVYDLIYNPSQTKLLALAKKRGAKTLNGLGMLLYQGVLSFKIWTDKEPPSKVMSDALKEGLTGCRI